MDDEEEALNLRHFSRFLRLVSLAQVRGAGDRLGAGPPQPCGCLREVVEARWCGDQRLWLGTGQVDAVWKEWQLATARESRD